MYLGSLFLCGCCSGEEAAVTGLPIITAMMMVITGAEELGEEAFLVAEALVAEAQVVVAALRKAAALAAVAVVVVEPPEAGKKRHKVQEAKAIKKFFI